ncbi:MAG: ABC transporter permease [Ruminococcaceae bacterium]|nr:ABC transporter permease [Oscillospiraceae bacterium]
MKKFGLIFSREFKETVRSKPFILISVIMAVIVLLLFLLPVMTAQSSDISSEYIATENDSYLYNCAIAEGSSEETAQLLGEALPYINLSARVTSDTSDYASLLKKYDAILVIRSESDYDCYESLDISQQSIKYLFDDALTSICRTRQLTELGVSATDAQSVLSVFVSGSSHFVGENAAGRYLLNYAVMILLFLSIALYGQMVATRIVSEKGSRTMEILITCANAQELLYGKVLGVGTAGLLQITCFSCASLLALSSASFAGIPYLTAFAPTDIVYLCLYFILGFLFMAFLYGGIGAMTERQEDLSGIANLPVYFFTAGYLIASFTGGEATPLLRFASFFPFWSPVVMFSRMAVEDVPAIQVIISIVILALSCILSAKLASKLYRRGMFIYGKAPVLSEILKSLRSENKK